jgi:hypothetical protein
MVRETGARSKPAFDPKFEAKVRVGSAKKKTNGRRRSVRQYAFSTSRTLPNGRGSDGSKPETWVTVLTEDMGNS